MQSELTGDYKSPDTGAPDDIDQKIAAGSLETTEDNPAPDAVSTKPKQTKTGGAYLIQPIKTQLRC